METQDTGRVVTREEITVDRFLTLFPRLSQREPTTLRTSFSLSLAGRAGPLGKSSEVYLAVLSEL